MGDITPVDPAVNLTEYLLVRLRQLGVKSMHGVPGDYNLIAMDFIEPAGLRWVGSANELNAGYAADGYARINGISALFTVFGVGELSAPNAIAGAFVEKVPVVHIVGVPSTAAQQSHLNLHHSLGDGNFHTFAEISKHFTCAQAYLSHENLHMATQLIDDTLQQCVQQSRPVYITLPSDLIKTQVSASRLREHIDISLPASEDLAVENLAVDHLLQCIYQSEKPLIVVDGFTSRYGITKETDELVRVTGLPTFTTPFGKGIINETYSNFHGIYPGPTGKSKHNMGVHSDLVILIAPLKTDVNTSCFLTLGDPESTIEIDRTSITISGTLYRHVNAQHVLRKVLDRLETAKLPQWKPYPGAKDARQKRDELSAPNAHAIIDQDSFWLRVSKFFQPGDVILTETGTPSSGGLEFVLPPDTAMINSSAWLSIGYTLGASAGVALAQRDILEEEKEEGEGNHLQTARRTILFEGDGSFQMTAQSISDIIRHRLDIIIFLINNDGYTIERFIHGMDADYNSIQPWKYLDSASYFGAPEDDDPSYPVFAKRASNWGELLAILDEPQLQSGKGFNMVEVMMRKDDATAALKELVKLAKQRNAGGK